MRREFRQGIPQSMSVSKKALNSVHRSALWEILILEGISVMFIARIE